MTETLGDYESPRFSPDGRRVAVRIGDPEQNVWILELSRGTLTRLTFEDGLRPLWSPDGQAIFFASTRYGIYNIFSKPADGSGPAQELVAAGPVQRYPAAITSDGSTLVFREGGGGENYNIGVVRLDGESDIQKVLDSPFNEHTPKLSPDDKWLAYVSNESGRDEIYVTRFPTGGKWQISTEGGNEPMWSRDGRELFYRNGERMMAVDVSAGADKAGRPTLLFEGPFQLKIGPGASNYDVTPDGQGFVMIRTPEGATQLSGLTHVTLVQNWFQELERLAPTH